MAVLLTRALLLAVYVGAPDLWKFLSSPMTRVMVVRMLRLARLARALRLMAPWPSFVLVKELSGQGYCRGITNYQCYGPIVLMQL